MGEVFNDGPLRVVKGAALLSLPNIAEGKINGIEEMEGGVDSFCGRLGLGEEVFEEGDADEAGGGSPVAGDAKHAGPLPGLLQDGAIEGCLTSVEGVEVDVVAQVSCMPWV